MERAAQTLVDTLKETLGKAVVATDVWEKGSRRSLAGHNPQETATKMFDDLFNYMEKSLHESQFPSLNRYFLIELEKDNAVIVVNFGTIIQGALINLSIANMGKVVSIAVPRLFRAWETVERRSY